MEIFCKQFGELSGEEVYEILSLRSEVFVVEQNCVYHDMDGKDRQSWHMMISEPDSIIACARILPPGISYPEASIGRVLVKKIRRRSGLGGELMKNAIGFCKRIFPGSDIVISAQTYLSDFYTTLGFIQEGEGYEEDGIPHVKMRLIKAAS